jgi:hypothetical protein
MLLHCNADGCIGEGSDRSGDRHLIAASIQVDPLKVLYFSTLVIYPRVDMSGAEFTEYRR